MFGRHKATTDEPSAATEPETPKSKAGYRYTPLFIIEGEPVVTDSDGIAEVDISKVPSGVTRIDMTSGGCIYPYHVDIDGVRVRNPEVGVLRFQMR